MQDNRYNVKIAGVEIACSDPQAVIDLLRLGNKAPAPAAPSGRRVIRRPGIRATLALPFLKEIAAAGSAGISSKALARKLETKPKGLGGARAAIHHLLAAKGFPSSLEAFQHVDAPGGGKIYFPGPKLAEIITAVEGPAPA